MSNTNSPFGFVAVGTSSGMPNYRQSKYRIISSDSNAVFFGDPVEWKTNTPTGYITAAVASDFSTNTYNNKLAGIFVGCEYLSTSQKRKVWSRYWPGSDATGDVTAWVIDDPNARFRVMGNSTVFNIGGTLSAWTTSPVGLLATFVMGSGSTATGQSGAYLAAQTDTSGAKAPFQVLDLVTDPPTSNGADPTTAYNHVIVGFVAEWLRSNSAVTGIS